MWLLMELGFELRWAASQGYTDYQDIVSVTREQRPWEGEPLSPVLWPESSTQTDLSTQKQQRSGPWKLEPKHLGSDLVVKLRGPLCRFCGLGRTF